MTTDRQIDVADAMSRLSRIGDVSVFSTKKGAEWKDIFSERTLRGADWVCVFVGETTSGPIHVEEGARTVDGAVSKVAMHVEALGMMPWEWKPKASIARAFATEEAAEPLATLRGAVEEVAQSYAARIPMPAPETQEDTARRRFRERNRNVRSA